MTIKRTLTAIALTVSAVALSSCSSNDSQKDSCPLWGRERAVCRQKIRAPEYENNKHQAPFRWAYSGKNSETNYILY